MLSMLYFLSMLSMLSMLSIFSVLSMLFMLILSILRCPLQLNQLQMTTDTLGQLTVEMLIASKFRLPDFSYLYLKWLKKVCESIA